MIRVVLPQHLRTLAGVQGEVQLDVNGQVTTRAILDALEARYPMLRGTIRDHDTFNRRSLVRFYACEQDLSHEPQDAPLPDSVVAGAEPFIILGAMAGGSRRRKGFRPLTWRGGADGFDGAVRLYEGRWREEPTWGRSTS